MGIRVWFPVITSVLRIKQPVFFVLAGLLLLAALVVLGGCGGSGDDGSAASTTNGFTVQANTTMAAAKPRLSKAAFVKRANQYCRKAWVIVGQNYRVYGRTQDPSLHGKERTADAIRMSLMAGIDFHIFDNIHFLGSPVGEEQEVEEIIGPMQEAVERGQRLGPLYSAAEVTALFGDFNRNASRYGLRDCLVNSQHLPI